MKILVFKFRPAFEGSVCSQDFPSAELAFRHCPAVASGSLGHLSSDSAGIQ